MQAKIVLTILVLFFISFSCSNTRNHEKSLIQLKYEEDYTPTYQEVIAYYELLEEASDKAKLLEAGLTDSGKALHLFIISEDGDFEPASNKAKGKTILFINNGIHPGEPCGIDASLKFADELVRDVDGMQAVLKTTTICIVPVYNVGGHLNRSKYMRANQIGPTETGFRGNARNLDLNRDFIKCDSENAKTFNKVFTDWDPDVFLDTHTTNGSDHQYAITLITTCPSAVPKPMEDFLRQVMLPNLYESMADSDYEMTPYVSWRNRDPEQGMTMFMETPRFSTGYSRLSNTYGFMTENHVYKPFKNRVLSLYEFIKTLTFFTHENQKEILETRKQSKTEMLQNETYTLDYKLDTTKFDVITFKGYAAGYYKSQLTGLERFAYNRNEPYEKEIPFYTYFSPVKTIEKPEYYILPSAWKEAVELLNINGIKMNTFKQDTSLRVNAKYIQDVSHPDRPYNGHFFHSSVQTRVKEMEIKILEGDYLIPLNQEKQAYIIECLEPEAKDSYFRWNFFDEILDAREYFSSWGFEENARLYLEAHPEFKAQWLEEIKNNPDLKNNHYEQMKYLYIHSEWFEKSYLRHPVYTIEAINEELLN